MTMANHTAIPHNLWTDYPFYYTPRPSVLPGVSDQALALAAPIIAYWVASLAFHALDVSDWRWLDKYRLHDSTEVVSRNLVTRTTVVWAVLLQQAIQTALGIFWMSDEGHEVNHASEMQRVAALIARVSPMVLGNSVAESWLKSEAHRLTYFSYWWFIPAIQLLWAMYVLRLL